MYDHRRDEIHRNGQNYIMRTSLLTQFTNIVRTHKSPGNMAHVMDTRNM